MNRFMIDIETLDTKTSAAVISIGAVKFDFSGDKIVDTGERYEPFQLVNSECWNFEVFVDLESSTGTIGAKTVSWWFDQIKNGVFPFDEKGLKLSEFNSLVALCEFLGEDDKEVWCKGTDFDVAILKDAFERNGIDVPWKYYEVRDMRTIVKMFDGKGEKRTVTKAKHSALGDAIDQANWLISVFESLDSKGRTSEKSTD